MKAPKFVIYTDHKVNNNMRDEYIECTETKFMDVFEKATEILENDDTVYLVRIYEVIKGTRCKEYERIANVRHNCTLEKIGGHTIERCSNGNRVWFE